ncbi:Poly(ADP-ribose) glycohydrolase isoform 1 [Schistosoma japonicum]|uniref:poly(ADP-ribose) glycohydrolase n=3 Tax=Schistosoma japonicum TaxID=6182 RepID=A0A4Z2CSV1_SCHJA|nr:Poly(ADP-ribose) glycohydrolase isoform 1 [Schistosoma japonicum]
MAESSECVQYSRGDTLKQLTLTPSYLPPLQPSRTHKVFFRCDSNSEKPPVPFPDDYHDRWDGLYVRMPCSPESVYPVCEGGANYLSSRWIFIEKALRNKIKCSTDLKEAILSYNSRFKSYWDFKALEHLCMMNLIPDGGNDNFFANTLPGICSLAINLPIFVTKPIPLLTSRKECSLTLSQLQIASLLANALFCTFPRRNCHGQDTEYVNFPQINFSNLLSARTESKLSANRTLHVKVEKLRCVLHYFYRVLQKFPTGSVTFTRRSLGGLAPDWLGSELTFDQLRLHVNATGSINDAGPNTLQVDFANSYLGGGVLNSGCLQEEIMFVLRPELLISCLFVERLEFDETLIIEGAEQYSVGSGYADDFCWAGDFNHSDCGMKRDKWGRWSYAVVAMDATKYNSRLKQYNSKEMLRELNKAYCGFSDDLFPERKLPPVVATGNWGCGAFKGDMELKCILQMMACLQAKKSLAYYTFGDKKFCDRIFEIYTLLSSEKVTVGRLWRILDKISGVDFIKNHSVFDFISQTLKCM